MIIQIFFLARLGRNPTKPHQVQFSPNSSYFFSFLSPIVLSSISYLSWHVKLYMLARQGLAQPNLTRFDFHPTRHLFFLLLFYHPSLIFFRHVKLYMLKLHLYFNYNCHVQQVTWASYLITREVIQQNCHFQDKCFKLFLK